MRQMTHPDYDHYFQQGGAIYANPTTNIVDYTPRMISQTVVNSVVTHASTSEADPAVADNQAFADVLNSDPNFQRDGFVRSLNSVSGDPGYSGWFVLFGQFFDHGLDFVSKPITNATITI